MKALFSSVSVLVAALLAYPASSLAMAPSPLGSSANPVCKSEPRPVTDPTLPVRLDLDLLRAHLFSGNTDILLAANNVHRAKNNVNVARGQLLPSLQLGTLISGAANPTFLLSSVDFLLPFLIPERWFNLSRSRELLNAEKESFHALQLNEYASAASLLLVLQNDLALESVLARSAEEWRELDRITRYLDQSGLTTPDAVLSVEAHRSFAELRLEKIKGLNLSHLADVRRALGLGMSQQLSLLPLALPVSPAEGMSKEDLLKVALERAPEDKQLSHLLIAAEKERWQAVWGFINGASFSSGINQPDTGRSHPSFAFDRLVVGGSFGIGFDYFPRIELTQRNLDDLKLRKNEIQYELSRIIDVSLEQLPLISRRSQLAHQAESSLQRAYRIVLERYRSAGSASLLDVITARMNIDEAALERLAADTELNLTRTSLHRLLRSGPFESVRGCELP